MTTAGASFMNCPYHALSEILTGALLRHREGHNVGFMGPFEDARRAYSTRSLYLLSPHDVERCCRA